jgi:hypothetical protein
LYSGADASGAATVMGPFYDADRAGEKVAQPARHCRRPIINRFVALINWAIGPS